MDFSLTEEQRLLVGTIREFVHRELKPLEEDVEASGTWQMMWQAKFGKNHRNWGFMLSIFPVNLVVAASQFLNG